jgi:pimeloyl-ACP methyl ester carboxylesterase
MRQLSGAHSSPCRESAVVTAFVLIHGGSHGAWCWHKLAVALGRLGCTAIAVDLPGSGIDKTPEAEITL